MSVNKYAVYDNDYVTLREVKNILGNPSSISTNAIKYTLPKSFGAQPNPPYTIGDTYTINGKTYACIASRNVGAFNSADWEESVPASKIIQYANNSPETDRIGKNRLDADIITTVNLSAQRINCDQLSGGVIRGQSIIGCSINASYFIFGNNTTTGFMTMGDATIHPWCSGLSVWGGNGVVFYNGTTIHNAGDRLGYIITDGNMTIHSNGNILLRPNGWSYGFTFSALDDYELTCNSTNAICFQDSQTKYTWGGGKLFYDRDGNGTNPSSTNDEVETTGHLSGKAYKKDIIVLTDEQLNDLSDLFASIPVSKYTYKYGSEKDQEKIGFILEDIQQINNNYTKYFPISSEIRYDTGENLMLKPEKDTDVPVEALYYSTKDLVSLLTAGLAAAHKKIKKLEEKINDK